MIPDRRIIIGALVALALLILLALFGWHEWQASRAAKTETRLATGQAGAAIESGQDLGATLGNRQSADAAGDQTVVETKDAIANAPDAGAVTDAGRSGLCGLAGNRRKPECVRKSAP